MDQVIGSGPNDRKRDRQAAVDWARELLAKDPRSWVILDTETTGLTNAEILQIGILWPDGTVALDVLLEPDFDRIGGTIPPGATAIHGITDAMVSGCCLKLTDILEGMERILWDRTVVVFNKQYDHTILHGCIDHRCGDDEHLVAKVWLASSKWECAMLPYAAFIGDWNEYRGNYKWQKLPASDHSAIGDCRATLAIIKQMAADEVTA